ncbi:MAG: tetraprenyl-beta-curcumene synthase family protein [Moorella sp. (in: firmicutes)]
MSLQTKSLVFLQRMLFQSFPAVEKELSNWRNVASLIPQQELRKQALASLREKKFHCQGGSVYATLSPAKSLRRQLLKAIVSLQTISDYLDNLSDRSGIVNEDAFRQLHLAFTDALTPEGRDHDYYSCYPYFRDGGYLAALVKTCRQALADLPGYKKMQGHIMELAHLYCHLQIVKHLEEGKREAILKKRLEPLAQKYGLYWWELAAATGSTLGIFALMAAAADDGSKDGAAALKETYFPWIGGLHILLDYFIDQQEDRRGGDLNFCSFYCSQDEAAARFKLFLRQAKDKAAGLPEPGFHLLVVKGLPALYLSDFKARDPGYLSTCKVILQEAGAFSQQLFLLCRFLRRIGVI